MQVFPLPQNFPPRHRHVSTVCPCYDSLGVCLSRRPLRVCRRLCTTFPGWKYFSLNYVWNINWKTFTRCYLSQGRTFQPEKRRVASKSISWRIFFSNVLIFLSLSFSGLNFQDLMVRLGAIDSPPKTPTIMGFECAGEVEAVGEEVEGFKVRHLTQQMGKVYNLVSGGGGKRRFYCNLRRARLFLDTSKQLSPPLRQGCNN